MIHSTTFYFNPIRVCTYLLWDEEKNAVLIDCGCSNERERRRLHDFLQKEQLELRAHLLTHAHIDHAYGARFVFEEYGILPHLHPNDEPLFSRLREQAAMFGLPLEDEPLDCFSPIQNDETLSFGDIRLGVIPSPGHTPGGVCYYSGNTNTLFSGDTLFQGGIGRTDLPGGDYANLISSLHNLCSLPPETMVFPGHGFPSTIGDEMRSNPYLQ